jgi:hypothetical protein
MFVFDGNTKRLPRTDEVFLPDEFVERFRTEF